MTGGELIEAVGIALCLDDGEPRCRTVCSICGQQAEDAIDLVLEEAAKVADAAGADEIASAIRARVAELEAALRPFAGKAVKWEANHPVRPGGYGHSHSTQVTHRLGDFRRARDVLKGASHEQG